MKLTSRITKLLEDAAQGNASIEETDGLLADVDRLIRAADHALTFLDSGLTGDINDPPVREQLRRILKGEEGRA